jgi:hypothetical protein
VVAPFFLFWMLIFKLLVFDVAGGIASAEATKGLSARPLETFGALPCYLICIVA